MSEQGRSVSGSARLPVGDMAMGMLDQLFPHLTGGQLDSLRNRTPMPPSPGYSPPTVGHPQYPFEVKKVTHEELAEQERRVFDGLLFRQVIARMQDVPLVTAVMAYGRPDPAAIKLARKAVNQFVLQSYPNKQLVIVNGTGTRVTNVAHREIKEVQVTDCPTVAALRNRGLELADGDWVKPCWDDDDAYDPHLLTFMMLHRRPGHAVMLSHQVRVAIWYATVFLHEDVSGVPNTAIVPRSDARFDDVGREDFEFVCRNFGVKSVVVSNPHFPANSLSVAVYHGDNRTPYEQFMGAYAEDGRRGRWFVGEAEAEHLKSVLAGFGLDAASRAPVAP